jgi:hypothetical protein
MKHLIFLLKIKQRKTFKIMEHNKQNFMILHFLCKDGIKTF